jgi:hypothetical protein
MDFRLISGLDLKDPSRKEPKKSPGDSVQNIIQQNDSID